MPSSAFTPFIDVPELRVGMYIHLEGGWISHPFPLNSFRLSAPDQIDTLRSLGLKQVRWVPAKSDVAFEAAARTPERDVSAGKTEPEHRLAGAVAERAALRRCERQFAQARHECARTLELVATEPQRAREGCEGLTRNLVREMATNGDLTIRLLGEAAGDRASLHVLNVAVISLLLGRACGLAEHDLHDLGVGALLHDIGKAELPERVRQASQTFTPAQLEHYRQHVALGVAAGRRMGLTANALLVIAEHHEHADGSGFPQRVTSDRMSIAARIVALVNRYDNLCSSRQPSHALTPHEAVSMLFARCKDQFDITVMSAFIRMMGVYPPGSAVQLTDDRYALVVAANSSRPLKPQVQVHDAKARGGPPMLVDLDRAVGLGIRRSLPPRQLPADALEALSPRRRVVYYFEPAPEQPER